MRKPVQKDRVLQVAAVVFVVMLLVPTVMHNTFYLRVLTEGFMWIGLALALDVLAGYTGHLNFGHHAFFGLGAYTTAILMMRAHWSFPLALLAGGVAGIIGALVIGLPTLRMRGAYFAIATWALGRVAQQIALRMEITGGPEGMRVTGYLNPFFFFYAMLVVTGATFFALWFLLERAPFGLKLKAIREDQDGGRALGLNATRLKLQALVVSAIPTALIGGVFAYWVTFIDPNSALGDLVSDQAVVMTVFGGMGTLIGPVLGAVIIFTFKTLFWSYLSAFEVLYVIILGALIALSVVFMPDGVVGLYYRRAGKSANKQAKPPTPAPSEEEA
jgi:branched-chain amino acid transport system permease protein